MYRFFKENIQGILLAGLSLLFSVAFIVLVATYSSMVSPVAKFYSVGSGEDIYAGMFHYPAWRQAIAANTWAEVGANTLADIDPANNPAINPNAANNAPWRGNSGLTHIVEPWCGACWDDESSVLWLPLQGGHGDYAGNEPYKNGLAVDSPLWEMVRNPSGAIGNEIVLDDGQEATGLYSDGRPRAIHSYNKPVYVPGVGIIIAVQGNTYKTGSSGTARTIIIDPVTGEMTRFGAACTSTGTISGGGACYDPSRHCVWWRGRATGRFAKYDIATDVWTNESGQSQGSGSTALTYLPDHDCILWVNGIHANGFAVFDCATGIVHFPSISGSFVGMALTGVCQPRWFDTNTLALWDNATDTTIINTLSFASDPRTDTWQVNQLPVDVSNTVTPTVRTGWGTYGRFFYSSKLDCFGVFNSIFDKLFIYARS